MVAILCLGFFILCIPQVVLYQESPTMMCPRLGSIPTLPVCRAVATVVRARTKEYRGTFNVAVVSTASVGVTTTWQNIENAVLDIIMSGGDECEGGVNLIGGTLARLHLNTP